MSKIVEGSRHEYFMRIAIEEAEKSGIDVPVGALLVKDNVIISKSSNKKEKNNDPTAHAEIIAIKEATAKLENWRLKDTTLYVTLEPCPMCAAAILYSRIPNIVFGAYDPLYGAFGSALNMQEFIKFNPNIKGGILEKECRKLLKNFFEEQRENNENKQ